MENPQELPGAVKRARVLVVEDEVIVAMELEQVLGRLGYQVVDTLVSGEQAVESARQLEPDLILMDIRLKGRLDGIEACEMIRASQDLPVIFLTAHGEAETVRRAMETNPYGYIRKPFDEGALFAAMEVALRKHRVKKNQEDLLRILDELEIGTVLTDADGKVVFLNSAADTLLGHKRSVVGKRWKAAFPIAEEMLQRLATNARLPVQERRKIRVRLEHDDGKHFWTEIDVRDYPLGSNRYLFVLYDVTEMFGLRRMLEEQATFYDIVGRSSPMQSVFHQIEQVAKVDSTVLIEGATGTGKELVARAIHSAGHRSSKPFIAVNCAALSEELAASQLFGHKKGSFTGAIDDRKGFFEAAEGGTLFLDEIGDVPLDVQVNLLRVLEQRAVTRVGETTPRPVDVRIIAATHRSLTTLVNDERFRSDLLYRIRVARVDLPALKQRREDIPLLVQFFLRQSHMTTGKRVSEASTQAMRMLMDYDWPGNVRELRNAIEYAVIRCSGPILQADDLPPEVTMSGLAQWNTDRKTPGDADRILAALEQTGGNRKEAAKLLDISRATLYRRLDEYDIE